MTRASAKERESAPDLLAQVAPKAAAKPEVIAPRRGVRGGYQPEAGGTKPKFPTTGSGVAAPAKQAVAIRDNAEPTTMLGVIARAAADPKVNPESMRALLDMQKEIAAEEARIAFTQDFIKLQAELPVINATGRIVIEGKGGKRGQDTPYATFNAIHKVCKPILTKHNFSLSFATEPSPDGSRIIVKTFLEHTRGHSRVTAFPLPAETSGSKNNVQGWGSAFSYGKRYGTIAILNLVSEAARDQDDDGFAAGKQIEGAKDESMTEEQSKELLALVDSSGVGGKRFCEKYGLEKVADLPQSKFVEARAALKNFAANNKG